MNCLYWQLTVCSCILTYVLGLSRRPSSSVISIFLTLSHNKPRPKYSDRRPDLVAKVGVWSTMNYDSLTLRRFKIESLKVVVESLKVELLKVELLS